MELEEPEQRHTLRERATDLLDKAEKAEKVLYGVMGGGSKNDEGVPPEGTLDQLEDILRQSSRTMSVVLELLEVLSARI